MILQNTTSLAIRFGKLEAVFQRTEHETTETSSFTTGIHNQTDSNNLGQI